MSTAESRSLSPWSKTVKWSVWLTPGVSGTCAVSLGVAPPKTVPVASAAAVSESNRPELTEMTRPDGSYAKLFGAMIVVPSMRHVLSPTSAMNASL